MRILLVSPYFPPINAVAASRTYSLARTWTDVGHEVTVLTTGKRDDQRTRPRDVTGISIAELSYELPAYLRRLRASSQGRTIAHDGPDRPATPTRLSRRPAARLRRWLERRGVMSSVRMPDVTDFWVRPAIVWLNTADAHWDVVVSSAGPYTAHLVARHARRAGLADWWLADFRDLWTRNHARHGLVPFTWRERWLERRVMADVDHITTVSDGLARTLREQSTKPVSVIFNGFDIPEDAMPSTRPERSREQVHLVYTGTWYPHGQRLETLYEAWVRLRDEAPDVAASLRLVVAGRDGPSWRRLAVRYGLESWIDWRGEVDQADAVALQRDADALLLIDWHRPDDGVLTGKVFEYIAQSAPIIVVGGDPDSPASQLVRRAGRGVAFGHDIEAIAAALRALVAAPSSLSSMPDEAFIRTLDRRHQAKRLLDIMCRRKRDEA